jgi:hypothetical protein
LEIQKISPHCFLKACEFQDSIQKNLEWQDSLKPENAAPLEKKLSEPILLPRDPLGIKLGP